MKKTYGLQNETKQYLRRLYAYGRTLRGEDINDIDNFVKGLKQLNLWNNAVCWPMRSIYNIGLGSTVLSLGGAGRYNGTMVNSPTWGEEGIIFTKTSSQKITAPFANFNGQSISIGGVVMGNSTTDVVFLLGLTMGLYRIGTALYVDAPYPSGRVSVATTTTSWYVPMGNKNGARVELVRDGVLIGSTSAALNILPFSSVEIGSATVNNWYLNGTMATAFILTKYISVTEAATLNKLLKQTICRGIILP